MSTIEKDIKKVSAPQPQSPPDSHNPHGELEKVLQQEMSNRRTMILTNTAVAPDMPAEANTKKYMFELQLLGDTIELTFKGRWDQFMQILPHLYNIKNGEAKKGTIQNMQAKNAPTATAENKDIVMAYAMRFLPAVFSAKQDGWVKMWENLLAADTMKKIFFAAGRQKFDINDKPFNRNGVVNVVGYIKHKYPQLFIEERNTNIANMVEGSSLHPIRQQLGNYNKLTKSEIETIETTYNKVFNK